MPVLTYRLPDTPIMFSGLSGPVRLDQLGEVVSDRRREQPHGDQDPVIEDGRVLGEEPIGPVGQW